MGLYEVLNHGQCVACGGCRSAHLKFGEAGRGTTMETKLCAAVEGSAKKIF